MSDSLTLDQTANDAPVVTERAARRVKQILAKELEGSLLRVAVNGGGCSGFQYAFDIVPDRAPADMLIERDGVGVVIDPVSLDFLRGGLNLVVYRHRLTFRSQRPHSSRRTTEPPA